MSHGDVGELLSAPASPADLLMPAASVIGARLRLERQARGLSLRELAQDIGVTASMLSQVETGRAQPSVATLYALASFLSVSIDQLLGLGLGAEQRLASSAGRSPAVQRRTDNPVIEMENGVRWERLAMGRGGPADALLVTYQPGASSSLEGKLMRHAGHEYAYLLSGTITVQLEFDTEVLEAGDSVYFDSSRPHMFTNAGDEPATGIWFVIGRREPENSAAAVPGLPRSGARSAVEVLQRIDEMG